MPGAESAQAGAATTSPDQARPEGVRAEQPQPGVSAAASLLGAVRGTPFADMPPSDYVRDAIALVLLLMSFGMPWDRFDSSTDKVYVILAALLSIASLALPYLKRANVLPATWGNSQLRLARLAANAPYVLIVAVTIVIDLVDGNLSGGDGVGVGMAFGLAGVIVAAQARRSELEPGQGDGPLWRLVALGTGAVIAVLSVVSLIIVLIDSNSLEWSDVTLFVLGLAFFVVIPGIALLGFARRDPSWRDVLVVLGTTGLLAGFWQLGADTSVGDAWSVRLAGPAALFWPALGAMVTAAAMPAIIPTGGGAARWITTAVRLFQLTVVSAGFGVVIAGVSLAAEETGRGPQITVLVLQLIVVAAALVGRNALTRDPKAGRQVALVVAGVFVVLGIVQAAVVGSSDTYPVAIFDVVAISILFAFAVAIVVLISAPKAVRAEYGPISTAQPAAQTSAVQAAPAQTPSGQAAPVHPTPARQPTPAQQAAPTHQSAPASPAPDLQATVVQASPVQPTQQDAATHQDAADQQATTIQPVTPAQASPAQQTTEQPAATPRYDAQIAADPSTPLAVLADIAATEAALRPYVAANPSTYPELLAWLGALGDPAVDEALRGRA